MTKELTPHSVWGIYWPGAALFLRHPPHFYSAVYIQKRSSEVWNLLAAVKTEWTKYGEVLAKVQKKLQEASNTVEDAAKRTRVIGRKLRDVQELPTHEAGALLMIESAANGDGEAEEEVQA